MRFSTGLAQRSHSFPAKLAAVFLLLDVFLFSPGAAFANPEVPFNRISTKLYGSPVIIQNSLQKFWRSAPEWGVALESPFYRGFMEIGLSAWSFEKTAPQYPDFKARIFYLGWGHSLQPSKRLSLFGGMVAGNFLMEFPGKKGNGSEPVTESEIALGWNTGGRWHFSQNGYLWSEVRRLTILTRREINFTTLNVGFAWQVNTPGWLRHFLAGNR